MDKKNRDFPNVKIGMNSCKINSFDLVIGDEICPHNEAWIDLIFVLSIKSFQTSLQKMVSINGFHMSSHLLKPSLFAHHSQRTTMFTHNSHTQSFRNNYVLECIMINIALENYQYTRSDNCVVQQ